MTTTKKTNYTKEIIERDWTVRFDEIKDKAIPLMFIDSIVPGHNRLNYALIGDTASENENYNPVITEPHGFQIGMVKAPKGNGPAFHTHEYIETFFVLTGEWRFYWGNSEDEIEGETILKPWDMISLPPYMYRGFENIAEEDAWLFSILEQHEVFDRPDPIWDPKVVKKGEEYNFRVDDKGKMIAPENFSQLEEEMAKKLKMGEK
ncbi:cupin domain-containing protein [Oceanobacillus kimchii]|uniref:cupin domain-containing protein n=1 Tax=Oceanobacillus kimchii TaxID=746691 RepID=UPI000347F766|nr:cupin domain-containing protein [Oceanobacillus kimchii]